MKSGSTLSKQKTIGKVEYFIKQSRRNPTVAFENKTAIIAVTTSVMRLHATQELVKAAAIVTIFDFNDDFAGAVIVSNGRSSR